MPMEANPTPTPVVHFTSEKRGWATQVKQANFRPTGGGRKYEPCPRLLIKFWQPVWRRYPSLPPPPWEGGVGEQRGTKKRKQRRQPQTCRDGKHTHLHPTPPKAHTHPSEGLSPLARARRHWLCGLRLRSHARHRSLLSGGQNLRHRWRKSKTQNKNAGRVGQKSFTQNKT